MIESLHIENIAVIKNVDISFGGGMTVLSGETGAGKSIIIDSINLLLGGRADRDLIRNGEKNGRVSAIFSGVSEAVVQKLYEMGFETEDGSVMISRTIGESGSSARINTRPVTVGVLREIAGMLLNIHGQNDNQQLLDPKNHIHILDSYAGIGEEVAEYDKLYKKVLSIRAEIDSASKDTMEQNRMSEMLKYQIADIDAVKLKPGEEEALEELVLKLRNLEKISKACSLVEKALMGGKGAGAIYLVDRSAGALDSISDSLPEAEALSERLNNIKYELEDIASSISELEDIGGDNPTAKLDKAEERLDAINKLKRKYGSSIEEILTFRDDAAKRLSLIENADERIEDLKEDLKKANAEALEAAKKISAKRKLAARGLTDGVTETLVFLEMPKVKFEVGVEKAESLNAYGIDNVEFLIATNVGDPLLPMAKIASGGELARIMLSLKNVLNVCDGLETVIFDEIDTGISGKTSRKVGIKLKEIGKTSQVLCVTHSAQIASLADRHLFISKREVDGRTETAVRELDEQGRIGEIARILGGIEITDAQRTAAEEMIAEGKNL